MFSLIHWVYCIMVKLYSISNKDFENAGYTLRFLKTVNRSTLVKNNRELVSFMLLISAYFKFELFKSPHFCTCSCPCRQIVHNS